MRGFVEGPHSVVFPFRGVYGYEEHISLLHRLRTETELVDRHPALGKSRDAFLILVDARSAMADVSEASPRGEPYVPTSYDPYLESFSHNPLQLHALLSLLPLNSTFSK
jgi:hypothetical protein